MSNPKPSKPFQRKFNNSISAKVDLKPSPKVKIHPDRHRFEHLKYLKTINPIIIPCVAFFFFFADRHNSKILQLRSGNLLLTLLEYFSE